MNFDDYARLVKARRTSMMVDRDRSVPTATVERLCDLAQWAPNHKRTWPMRFAHCTGEGRARLGEAFVEDMITTGTGDAAKREKTKTKYLRAPSVLVIGCAPPVSMNLVADDRDAVAAGVQTLLLGATNSRQSTLRVRVRRSHRWCCLPRMADRRRRDPQSTTGPRRRSILSALRGSATGGSGLRCPIDGRRESSLACRTDRREP
jgi:nitroreductase